MSLKSSMRKALYESAHTNKKRSKQDEQAGRQGFMMIEAVFSIFIVSTILVTFMAVMGSVYRTEFAKRDLIIASNLAQEGIEIVRNIRDNNWKASPAKNAFLNPFPPVGSGFHVAYDDNYSLNPPMSGGSSVLYKNDTSRFYSHKSAGATATKFSRTIDVAAPSTDSRRITVRVDWDGKNIEMTDTLYAWGDVD